MEERKYLLFNLRLLQTSLTVKEYSNYSDDLYRTLRLPEYQQSLPEYLIARCPICSTEIIERLDTYSLKYWPGLQYEGGRSVPGGNIVRQCEHFALVQPFINFNGLIPYEAAALDSFFKDGNEFGPEVPHVIGYLLEKGRDCLAVIHALPVCRIEGEAFVPRYTMFMVSYFSHHKPEDVRDDMKWFGNIGYMEVQVDIFSEPPDGTDHWWDLKRWLADGLLYWVDGNDPGLGLRTRDPEAFPYGEVRGRCVPYIGYVSTQERILKGEFRDEFGGKKPRIKAFQKIKLADEYGDLGFKMIIDWENEKGASIGCANYAPGEFVIKSDGGMVLYYLPPANFVGVGHTVKILKRDMECFELQRDSASSLFEVVLCVKYSPGERTLGLTKDKNKAMFWINELNKLLKKNRRRG